MKLEKMILLMLGLVLVINLIGCKEQTPTYNESNSNQVEKEETQELEVVEEKDLKEDIDLLLKPNEAGEIMVLMYHNVGEVEEEWVRTPENLKKDLKTLYEKNYRAVSLKDYVNNEMDVAEGMTPVVLTFDDGNENNFRMIKNEKGEDVIDPDSVIGILESFKSEHPDFNTTAIFFVFGINPFRQPEFVEYKFNYLLENRYDIGNHTIDHRGMKKLDNKEIIQEVIGGQVSNINKVIPSYNVNTYALCYGERPKGEELEKYLEKGEHDGTSYENIAILNVGWNPAKSPITTEFNPLSIPRIRASEMKVDNVGMYDWLEYFDNNPGKRYISDGVKEIITIPLNLEESIDKEKLNEKELYIYSVE